MKPAHYRIPTHPCPFLSQHADFTTTIALLLPAMPAAEKPKTAIVVGAGVGGISTAARLARAGFRVTLLEKNSFTGGRCSLLHSPDGQYRFDQGPSLLLLPGLFRRTFEELGTSLEQEGVELLKCEPNYKIHFGDGGRFELSSDLANMKREVEKWEGKGGFERYLEYLKEAHAHYELSVEHVLLKNFTSLGSMFRPDFLKRLLQLHPFESIWTRAGKYFWTERLRRVFTFGSMYMGMSPFDAPGTYSLLQYTELAEGIWYPVGGFHRVVQALEAAGRREGVEFRMSTAVKRIVLSADGARAEGVELENGEVLKANVVVNNSDLVYAYSHLLPESDYAASLTDRPGSCSSISFYWALDTKVPELSAHNIFLADEYKESFDSIFKKHLIPDEPSFYVNVPSRVDPSAAPAGGDSVVVLVPVGHLTEASGNTERQNWPQMVSLARKTILSTIKSRTGADLSAHIIHEQTNDPLTWKTNFNLDKGAILGLSHSFFNVLCFRPSTRARRPGAFDSTIKTLGVAGRVLEVLVDLVRGAGRDVKGLYMVGASAHPGTGVPIVLAGGALVAEQVCDDLGISVPWRQGGKDGLRVRSKLDRVERPVWLDSSRDWMFLALVLGMLLGVLLVGMYVDLGVGLAK